MMSQRLMERYDFRPEIQVPPRELMIVQLEEQFLVDFLPFPEVGRRLPRDLERNFQRRLISRMAQTGYMRGPWWPWDFNENPIGLRGYFFPDLETLEEERRVEEWVTEELARRMRALGRNWVEDDVVGATDKKVRGECKNTPQLLRFRPGHEPPRPVEEVLVDVSNAERGSRGTRCRWCTYSHRTLFNRHTFDEHGEPRNVPLEPELPYYRGIPTTVTYETEGGWRERELERSWLYNETAHIDLSFRDPGQEIRGLGASPPPSPATFTVAIVITTYLAATDGGRLERTGLASLWGAGSIPSATTCKTTTIGASSSVN